MLRILVVLGGLLVTWLPVQWSDSVALSVAGFVLGLAIAGAGLFVRFNRPHHRVIVRDALGHIVDCPSTSMFLAVPLYDRLTEWFDLNQRFTTLEERSITTLEGLPTLVSVRIGYVVDPAGLDDETRQAVIDGMGASAERWAQRVQEETRAALDQLVQPFTHPELASAEGRQDLQSQLHGVLQRQLAGLGVSIVQALILQVTPSAQIVDIRTDMLHWQMLAELVQKKLLPILPTLTPYTDRPIEALLAFGLLDRFGNRRPDGLTVNVLPGTPTGNGHTPAVDPNPSITFPMLAGR